MCCGLLMPVVLIVSRVIVAGAASAAFLNQWPEQARSLGWTANDLFGLNPAAPLARYDGMGLCWLLRGQRVKAITDRTATIGTPSGGTLTYYRRRIASLTGTKETK
jgi:hypothetical protein